MPVKLAKVKVKPVIELTTDHTGKMLGMQSLSTSCRTNPGCLRNSKIPGSICEKCYAQTMLQMYKDLDAKTERNTEVLTKEILDMADLPVINCQIFRFESFGDIHNEIHLQNYINIAIKNPGCMFTLWTKNYSVALNYFKTHDCPENFTLIISSLFINKKQDLTPFKKLGKFRKGQLKVFTVYDYDYIRLHHDDININCGSRLCMGCQLCYRKNEVEEINEILKSDQEKTEEFLDRISPDFDDRMSNVLDDISDVFDTEDDSVTGGGEDADLQEVKEEELEDSSSDTSAGAASCTGCCSECPYSSGCSGNNIQNDEFVDKLVKEQKVDNMVEVISTLVRGMKEEGKFDLLDNILHEAIQKLCKEETFNEDSEGKND